MSSQKLVKLLNQGNARFVRQSGTSHAIFERESDGRMYRAPVIMAKSDLSSNLLPFSAQNIATLARAKKIDGHRGLIA
jgi:predicted RNA binding protein YcfA (HicA-like mRNA interferase family)